MVSLLTKAVGLLLAFVINPENAVGSSPCAQVRVPAYTVLFGSTVSASCILSADCPLAQGQDVQVEWHLNEQTLPEGAVTNQSTRTYGVVMPNFTDTRGHLTCCVRTQTECQVVGGVEIKAGYPPLPPYNLSCLTNLTKPYTMSCKWTPGASTLLPTAYVLHTEIRHSRAEKKTYFLPEGVHSYVIPRVDFSLFTKMRIFVTATNSLGQASSEPLLLDPMENAQFDPPEVMAVWAEPHRTSCLKIRWRLSDHQAWVIVTLEIDISLKAQDSQWWTSAMKHVESPADLEEVELCGLLHGTEYYTRVRVRYPPGPWSAWSKPWPGTTLEKAPTGQLTTWLKVSGDPSWTRTALLFWKPSHQYQANGKNMSYHVFLQWPPDRQRVDALCDTVKDHCVFSLPWGAERVGITARNSAGESEPTWVPVYHHTDLDPVSHLRASPARYGGLLVTWVAPDSPDLVGFTVEWNPLLETDLSSLSFGKATRNESSLFIADHFEPYRPYKISVYSKYHDGIGSPNIVEAYSRQKAPSEAPQPQVTEIQHTSVELTWNDIPLEHRNGIIQGYTIYYWNEEDQVEALSVKPSKRRLTLRNLKPLSMYKVLIQASTAGGSRNGTILTIKTEAADVWDIMLSMLLICALLLLPVSMASFICFKKRERLKMRLWPMVPDPANSSIRDWKEADTLRVGFQTDQKDIHRVQDIYEPSPVKLSLLNLLDVLEKEDGDAEENRQQDGMKGGEIGNCTSGPLGLNRDQSPRNSVPYVTVVFASPYRSQASATAYLRSESTQPLLGEEPSSPSLSQVGAVEPGSFNECDGGVQDHEGGCASWDDFPMLGALEIQESFD